jgi:hypothetical protein
MIELAGILKDCGRVKLGWGGGNLGLSLSFREMIHFSSLSLSLTPTL